MATPIPFINASLDGTIADGHGNFDSCFTDLHRSVGTVRCGRRMDASMRVGDTVVIDERSEVQRAFAEAWRDTDTAAYSSTLDAVPEPRTRLDTIPPTGGVSPDRTLTSIVTESGSASDPSAPVYGITPRRGASIDRTGTRGSSRHRCGAEEPVGTTDRRT